MSLADDVAKNEDHPPYKAKAGLLELFHIASCFSHPHILFVFEPDWLKVSLLDGLMLPSDIVASNSPVA